jgi:hypothetical protein
MLAVLAIVLTGCSSARPIVRPEQPASLDPTLPMVEWLEANPGDPPRPLVSITVQGCLDVEGLRVSCLRDLADVRDLAGIDSQVAAGQLAHERARAERYASQRWWCLGGGAAAGIVGTVLLMVLAR